MRKKYIVQLVACLVLTFAGLAHADTFFEDNFNDGDLDGWTPEGAATSTGDVSAVTGVAILADGTDWYSALYQGIPLDAGAYVLEFDVFNGLSSDDGGVFFDTFYASLYFINDLSQFDLDPYTPVFDDVDPLFDMDRGTFDSFFDVFVELSPSGLGTDWTHITYEFTNTYQYVIPTFELFDFNYISGDSTVGIDNVSITPVPEPATFLLVGWGMAGLALYRRKQRV